MSKEQLLKEIAAIENRIKDHEKFDNYCRSDFEEDLRCLSEMFNTLKSLLRSKYNVTT